MYVKGFKIAISTNFVILLMIGMMLTNVVITYFWQQQAVKRSVQYTRAYLSLFTSEKQIYCQGEDLFSTSRERMVQYNEKSGETTTFLAMMRDDELFNNGHKVSDSVLSAVLQQSAQSQSEQIQSIGNYLSPFGLSARKVVVAVPVQDCDELKAIGMIVNLPSVLHRVHEYQTAILIYILINALVLGTLWFFRARRLVFTPLEKLVNMSESFGIAESDFIGPVSKKNEFGQLADALRNMLARIETDKEKLSQTVKSLKEANRQILDNQANLVEAEKFAAVGRLSAGLAHEIGNPLGIIQGYIELLGRDDVSEEDRRQYQQRADKELSRVTALIQNLLDLARKKKEGKESTHVQPVVEEVVDMLQQQKSGKDISFIIHCDEISEKVQCSEAELHQVLLNCLLNSVDAIHEKENIEGVISLKCMMADYRSSQAANIVIEDNGRGVEEAVLSSVFDPFFTTKKIGHGTGLGLSVSRSIIENSGGEMRVQSEVAKGTVVTIILPVVS